MKISPISPQFNTKIKHNNIQNNNEQNYASFSEQNFTSQNFLSLYAKSAVINFGRHKNREHKQNINFDLFKLRKGATPDSYQIDAARKLDAGESVLVSAPTGTGKTAIAQFIISKNLEEGNRTFYTTPLKALSNQKLLDFRKIYGEENVGIMTGDRKENPKAPIVIMTTEVYRNMAFDQYFNNKQNIGDNVKTVIFDEFHYLGDPQRGNAWEESVIFTPPKIQILGLSATIGNDESVVDWLQAIKKDSKVSLIHVPSSERHVPLRFFRYGTSAHQLKIYPGQERIEESSNFEIIKERGELTDGEKFFAELLSEQIISPNDRFDKADLKASKRKPTIVKIKSRANAMDYATLINIMDEQDMLPAILFVFSKQNCNYYADMLKSTSYLGDLNSRQEKEEIKETIRKYKDKYKYIGNNINYEALMNGYAVHHAGIMPAEKELIEDLFNRKLVKVVFATETLAAGINMPAKSVVITSPEKPFSSSDGGFNTRPLTSNEYHQMAGRAGRRGIDSEGFVVNIDTNNNEEEMFEELIETSSNPIISRFTPSYSLIANYHRYGVSDDEIAAIFQKSFNIHSSDTDKKASKINSMKRIYDAKAKIMEDEGFIERIDGNNIYLTEKGELLQNITGYPQIPLINLITSKGMSKLSPEELVFFASAIVCGQYTHTNSAEDMGEEIEDLTIPNPAQKYIKRDIYKLNAENDFNLSIPNTIELEETLNLYKRYCSNYSQKLRSYDMTEPYPLDINLKLAAHIYSLAAMNSDPSQSSISNWKAIIPLVENDGGIKDEGTFYTVVNQTIELLSQMSDVCDDTKDLYTLRNEKDRKYYDSLSRKLKTAVLLLKQKPVRENKLGL